MYVHIYVPQCDCRVQRVTCKSCFGLCIMWIPGIELRLPGLASSAFTCGAICVFYVFVRVFQGKIRETFENMKTGRTKPIMQTLLCHNKKTNCLSPSSPLFLFCFVFYFLYYFLLYPLLPLSTFGKNHPHSHVYIGEPLVFFLGNIIIKA